MAKLENSIIISTEEYERSVKEVREQLITFLTTQSSTVPKSTAIAIKTFSQSLAEIIVAKILNSLEFYDNLRYGIKGSRGIAKIVAGMFSDTGGVITFTYNTTTFTLTGTLADQSLTPGTYGDVGFIPIITVNQKGIITGINSRAETGGAGNTPITDELPPETPNGIITDFTTSVRFVPDTLQVWMEGNKQIRGIDFVEAASDDGYTFTNPPKTGVTIDHSFIPV